LLKELTDLKVDLEKISKLVKVYSDRSPFSRIIESSKESTAQSWIGKIRVSIIHLFTARSRAP